MQLLRKQEKVITKFVNIGFLGDRKGIKTNKFGDNFYTYKLNSCQCVQHWMDPITEIL